MMHRILSLIISMTAAASLGWTSDLELGMAIEAALDNSPAIHAAAERAGAAAARQHQAKGFRLPSVDLMASYTYTNNPAEVFALQLNQERFTMDDFFGSDPNNPDPLSNWLTRLEISWPLYTGGELSDRIDQASYMATAEELQLAHRRESVAFETTTAFVNLAKAVEYLDLMERSRKTTQRHVELAEKYAAQGMLLDAEVLKAQVHLAEMDELLAQAAEGVELAQAALAFNMGDEQSTRYTLAPLPPPPPVQGEMGDWTSAAVDRRRDLTAAHRELSAGELEVDASRSAFKPKIALVGRYDLYDQTFLAGDGSSGALMAMASINLYRGGADDARVEAARRDAAAGAADIQRFKEGILLEVRQAWHDVATARTRRSTAAASMTAAREALRVREHRFSQGLDKMIDLIDAETAVRGAEVRELVARYDHTLATYRLYFSSGASLVDLTNTTEE